MPLVEVGELQLWYETLGDERGRPVLLVPSHEGQLVWWPQPLRDELAARGHLVIAYDTRDAGYSMRADDGPVPDFDAIVAGDLSSVPYRLTDLADDAVGLLDALGVPSAHVVGHATGGMVAQLMALRARDRVRSLTLVTTSGGNGVTGPVEASRLERFLDPLPTDREEHVALRLARNRGVSSAEGIYEEAVERAVLEQVFDRGFRPRTFAAEEARKLAAIITAEERFEALAGLDLPVTVIHGDHDPMLPLEEGERLAAAIGGAAFVVVPGLGHDLPPTVWPLIIEALEAAGPR